MNQAAERHLAKAGDYLGKGEAFYRKAAGEIVAAMDADTTIGYREVGESLGRSKDWARKVVAWATSGEAPPTPFAEPGRDNPDVRGTKRILREAPVEQIEQIISTLPPERQRQIGAAAGNEYLRASQDSREERGRRTPAEQDEIERAQEQITRPVRQAVAGFTSLGIAQHLEQAAENLHELAADQSLTAEAMAPIERAHLKWQEAYRFAMQLAGLEV